jgi:hypothetical protein
MNAPPKAPPPPAKRSPAPPPTPSAAAAAVVDMDFTVTHGRVKDVGEKVTIYGTGGSGKSTLAALLKEVGINPLILDLDGGTKHLDVSRVDITSWSMLRAALQKKELIKQFGAVVIDDLTKGEEYCCTHIVQTIKKTVNNQKVTVQSIEDYGWGDGYGYLYHEFLNMLGDLDAIARMGVHVICIAHDCTNSVPNPVGENFIRYEPRLQSPKSGKDSVRARVKEWTDHLLFLGYDIAVENGKARGGGTRTIYTSETPTALAKSRTLRGDIAYTEGSVELWNRLFVNGDAE